MVKMIIPTILKLAVERGLTVDFNPTACPTCGHYSCICLIKKVHKEDCKFRRASICTVAIECDHGRSVCPICDPCTCREIEMPKVTKVEHARKEIPSIGVKVGDSYYKWRIRTQGGSIKRVSKTPPRPSQLTMSEFKSQYREFGERIQDMDLDGSLYDNLQEVAGELRQLAEEQREKRENMPEQLQDSESGQLLETRAENCEAWADSIENLEEIEEPDEDTVKTNVIQEKDQSDDDYEAAKEDAWAKAQEEYEGLLTNMRSEAIDADPGEE